MDAIERAVPAPQAEVIVHGASGRQVLGRRAPLAAGAQQVHHAVEHLADIDPPFAATGLARRDQRLDNLTKPTWLNSRPKNGKTLKLQQLGVLQKFYSGVIHPITFRCGTEAEGQTDPIPRAQQALEAPQV